MRTEPEEAKVPGPARGHDVFVSYLRADRGGVVELTQSLAARGKRACAPFENLLAVVESSVTRERTPEERDTYLGESL